MASVPGLGTGLLRSLMDRDASLLLRSLRSTRPLITVQSYIEGVPANRAVACWQGAVLAGVSVVALQTQHSTGPATVVSVIQDPVMSEAAIRLVARLGVSGLWGFDFVRETATGLAYLIEANPRATPICHLPLGAGQDLPAALFAAITGNAVAVREAIDFSQPIALFPGEMQRDPLSPYLALGHHDVPWHEPGLIADCVDRPWAQRGWLARIAALLRGIRKPSLAGPVRSVAPPVRARRALRPPL
jgi:hypothetical protein